MRFLKKLFFILVLVMLSDSIQIPLWAGNKLQITPAVSFVSRYIWRGAMVNDAPNVQPSVTMSYSGFAVGFWGSSTLAQTTQNNYPLSHELDTWAGYNYRFKSGISIGCVLTDYYFPNAGIPVGNFNNYDDKGGPGAHTLEAGFTLSAPNTFPITFATYVNVYNDAGNNTYFQLDYSTQLANIDLDFFAGAAGGSEKNPSYYGTRNFNVINLGFTASKSLKLSDRFSLPIFVSYVLNPRSEVEYLIFGFSL